MPAASLLLRRGRRCLPRSERRRQLLGTHLAGAIIGQTLAAAAPSPPPVPAAFALSRAWSRHRRPLAKARVGSIKSAKCSEKFGLHRVSPGFAAISRPTLARSNVPGRRGDSILRALGDVEQQSFAHSFDSSKENAVCQSEMNRSGHRPLARRRCLQIFPTSRRDPPSALQPAPDSFCKTRQGRGKRRILPPNRKRFAEGSWPGRHRQGTKCEGEDYPAGSLRLPVTSSVEERPSPVHDSC